MKRIFNWTLGSFFRTLGRIICYLSIGLLIGLIASKMGFNLFIMPVNATTNDGWLYNVKNNIQNTHFYDLGSGTNYTWYDSVLSGIQLDEAGNNWNFFHPEKAHTIASNGLMYSFYSGTSFKLGYLYNLQYYACSSAKVNYETVDTTLFLGSNATQNAQRINNISYQTSSITGLSSYPSESSTTKFNYCHQVNVLFVPSTDSLQWLGMRYTAKNNSFSTYLYEFGYNINELGVYTDTIRAIIENSNGSVKEAVDKVAEETKKTNDTITNDNVSEAESSAGNFFSGFNTETHGLTGIITAPLNAIQSLTSKTCSSLFLPLPFVNENLTLPCMRPIYVEHFGPFMNLYDIITLGIVSYWVMVRIFTLVKDFKNPDHDEIEVMDL